MRPGFDFDPSEQTLKHGLDFWHHGVVPSFDVASWVFGVGLAVAGLLYFVPAVTAFVRGHPNRVAILLLNVLLGWTFFGWAGALVWAATNTRKPL